MGRIIIRYTNQTNTQQEKGTKHSVNTEVDNENDEFCDEAMPPS